MYVGDFIVFGVISLNFENSCLSLVGFFFMCCFLLYACFVRASLCFCMFCLFLLFL